MVLHKLTAKPLDPEEQQQIVSQKLAWILEHSAPGRVILFGSAASGAMTTASDVDLVLIFCSLIDLQQAKKALFAAKSPDAWPQDLLLYTEASFTAAVATGGGAAWIAANEGRVLFDKSGEGG